MKKLLIITTILAFAVACPLAFAAEKQVKVEKKVNCCIKGDCVEKASKAECTKEKGKVVKDCKQCKPAAKPK